MLLAAWNEGVGSCPNGLQAPEDAQSALSLDADEGIAIVLTFGYPARPGDPQRRTPEEWSERANRKPLDELVKRV
jgi:nitroreductase